MLETLHIVLDVVQFILIVLLYKKVKEDDSEE